jgi:peptidoglycan/xylan/chitin deacetylase (PgdA/CDA1 family)
VRVAHSLLAVTCALSTLVSSSALGAGPAAAQDPRGAFKVADTPLPPAGPGEAVVALTFDDGPHPDYTPKVLEILRRYNIKATFFMLGSQAEKYPDLVKQVQADGHSIANHTYTHPRLPRLDDAGFSAQVDRTQDVIEGITGQRPNCLRPPYGDSDANTVARLAARNLTPVFWTQDSTDFEKPGVQAIVDHALMHLGNGSIILMHDAGGDRAQTLAALPTVIEQIKTRGFGFVQLCQPDVHIPKGSVESVEPLRGRLRVTGWVVDPDTSDPIVADVLVDGTEVVSQPADVARPELAEKGLTPNHGFDVTLKATPGPHEVCVRGMNTGPGSSNPSVGCLTAEVISPVPFPIDEVVNRVRFIHSLQQLALLDPSERVREAYAAMWSVLLLLRD